MYNIYTMDMNEHLLDRNFQLSLYPNVAVTEDVVTFPLYNLSGQMVGYQTYNPSLPKLHIDDPKLARYYTYVTKPTASKNSELAVWGLETVKWNDSVLFLTEGIFDACRLHMFALPAIAVLSNNPVHLTSWLKTMPSVKVACVQGDTAGQKLAKYGDECVMLPEGKDIGDLKNREFLRTFEKWLR